MSKPLNSFAVLTAAVTQVRIPTKSATDSD